MEQSRIIYLHQRYLNQGLTIQELNEWKGILDDPGQEAFLKELVKGT